MSRYPVPWDLFLGLAKDMPSGHRSLVKDARSMSSRSDPQMILVGADNIPSEGRLVLAANHYQRRGLWIAWPGAAMTKAVADRRGDEPPLHWLVTGGLRWCQWKKAGPPVPLVNALFQRVAQTYEMAALPLGGATSRAAALKQWIRWALRNEAVAIFPEGLSGSADALRQPEAGFENLCRLLALNECTFVPCGIYEEDSKLIVRFGEPVDSPLLLFPGERSRGDVIMEAIATLLPLELRGSYSGAKNS